MNQSYGQINEALEKSSIADRYRIVASRDFSGHGTAVMGIAAGNGRESEGILRSVADEASSCLCFVCKNAFSSG